MQKLEILSDAAKYDVSCSSSGSDRQTPKGGIGNAASCGICHTWTADGRCVSLLKILFTNICVYDCAYCINRAGNDIPRAAFTPEEIAYLTINFYKRNYIEGLFLSSGVIKNPDHTMELLIRTLTILREEYKFGGYIHAKLIPDASEESILKISALADRVSANIELPSRTSLKLLAPQKANNIFQPMQVIHKHHQQLPTLYKRQQGKTSMSTQMIIGATPESDLQILKLTQSLYDKALLKRVYFSAYMPINQSNNLPSVQTKPPLLREHRLYQADWLLRFYGFHCNEILEEHMPNLDERFDPKTGWALRHLDLFPMDINRVEKEMLLRIPGIGVRSAHKILKARRFGQLSESDLKQIGVVLKRARFFIVTRGKYLGKIRFNEESIASRLLNKDSTRHYQPSLFEPSTLPSTISGEI